MSPMLASTSKDSTLESLEMELAEMEVKLLAAAVDTVGVGAWLSAEPDPPPQAVSATVASVDRARAKEGFVFMDDLQKVQEFNSYS